MVEIVNLTEETKPRYFVCLEEWNEQLNGVKSIKEDWYNKMKDKGLRVKLAKNTENEITGMIEYMPVEYSYAEGNRLYFVNCIWVHGYETKGMGNKQGKGIGKALLKAAEDDVKKMGMDGLGVWGLSEPIWMNALWFEKQGYEKTDQIKWFVLLWKAFNTDAVQPKWKKGEFKQELIPGKVKVTAFRNGQCSSENSIYYAAKRSATEFGDQATQAANAGSAGVSLGDGPQQE